MQLTMLAKQTLLIQITGLEIPNTHSQLSHLTLRYDDLLEHGKDATGNRDGSHGRIVCGYQLASLRSVQQRPADRM